MAVLDNIRVNRGISFLKKFAFFFLFGEVSFPISDVSRDFGSFKAFTFQDITSLNSVFWHKSKSIS